MQSMGHCRRCFCIGACRGQSLLRVYRVVVSMNQIVQCAGVVRMMSVDKFEELRSFLLLLESLCAFRDRTQYG